MLYLARFLAVVSALLMPAHVGAQSIETDPFIQENIARENWEPGGKFSTLPTRGTVIPSTREGQVDIIPQHTQRLGSFSLQSANVQGNYDYTIDITGNHPHTVHSPFDDTTTSSSSQRVDRPDGSQASIELNWDGTRVHPANGYDPPAGGGFPAPDPRGAVDHYSYQINGIATGVFPLSPSELQRLDPPRDVLDRLSRAGELISDDFLDGLRRAAQGYDDFSTDAGLRGNLNAFLDTVTGAGRAIVSPATGGVSGLAGDEIANAITAMADLSVDGFKAFDVRKQYQSIQVAHNTGRFLDQNPEIAKTLEALGYVAIGGAILKKAIKGPKGKIDGNPTAPVREVRIHDASSRHIFRDQPGHIPDTPENRRLLQDMTSNDANYLGTDRHGNQWYAQTQNDGTQVWTSVRNGEIRNGGVNDSPRNFNEETGLSRPSPSSE